VFSNIGSKIKGLAQILAAIGIVASIIAGLYYFYQAGQYYSFGGESLAIIAFGFFIGGSLGSLLLSWFIYGFGELIEKTAEVARNTNSDYHDTTSSKTLTAIKRQNELLSVLLTQAHTQSETDQQTYDTESEIASDHEEDNDQVPRLIKGIDDNNWICSHCGEKQPKSRHICWKCGAVFKANSSTTVDRDGAS